MTGDFPAIRPFGAAPLAQAAQALMDVILHLGAHRTGTTTFQHYARDRTDALGQHGIGYWGPVRVRRSVFPGLFRSGPTPVSRRAEGRVQLLTANAEARGLEKLLVSDENMPGTCQMAFRQATLYPAAGDRLARLGAAFGGRVTRAVLSIRTLDLWWASAAALTLARGHRVPDPDRFARIAQSSRSWRAVITDLACALPDTEICVMPFERFAARPQAILQQATDLALAPDSQTGWLNRSLPLERLRDSLTERGSDPSVLPQGQGRWQPFTASQVTRLRETYADDLLWLAAGADGLARLTQDDTRKRAGPSLPAGPITKGQANDQGHMARYR